MRPVCRAVCSVPPASFSSSGVTMERRQLLSSERNSGLLQKAVTPASLASSSMSSQS